MFGDGKPNIMRGMLGAIDEKVEEEGVDSMEKMMELVRPQLEKEKKDRKKLGKKKKVV